MSRALLCAAAAVAIASGASEKLVPFEENGKWGYRDAAGKAVIAPRFELAGDFLPEGIAPVSDESGWAYIDARGRILVRPFLFDNGPDYFREGLARFVSGGKFGFFDRRGRIVVPAKFTFAAPFSEGRAAVCDGCKEVRAGEHRLVEGGKWGFIDRRGELVIPLQFKEAGSFQGGTARVRAGGAVRRIDSRGALLPAPKTGKNAPLR
jgi:hypothetical protein